MILSLSKGCHCVFLEKILVSMDENAEKDGHKQSDWKSQYLPLIDVSFNVKARQRLTNLAIRIALMSYYHVNKRDGAKRQWLVSD